MLLALAIGFGMILIMAGALLIVRTQLSLGTASTNNETSRDVAESGVDQYLWQLNQDSTFFTDKPNDPLNSAACIPVYKAPSVILGYFVLDIVPPTTQFPYFAVQSTGWLASNNADPNNPAPPTNSMNKTVLVADMRQKQFTDYVDFCNTSEVPAGYPHSGGSVEDWKGTGDIVTGPYKTNGNLRTLGNPSFTGTVEFGSGETSSWEIYGVGTYPWVNNGFSSSPWGLPPADLPTFTLNVPAGNNIYPRFTANLTMPSTNDLNQLDTWAHTDDQLYMTQHAVSYHTAEFPGRTCIYLHGSQFDEVYYDPSLNSYVTEHNVPLPPNQVIYVNGTSAGGTNGEDANYFNTTNGGDKFNPAFGNVFVSGYLTGQQLTIAANNDIFITAFNPTLPWASTTYTGGIWYESIGNFTPNLTTSTDLLGLIANEDARILGSDWPDNSITDLHATPPVYYTSVPDVNPNSVTYTSSHWGLTAADIYVQGAVMTVNGVFDAEGWDGGPYATNYEGGTGDKGHLNLTGCYAMNYDGFFADYAGSFNNPQNNGYGEDDVYDPRFQYETSPHFLQPKYSGWEVINWHSVPDVVALTPTTLPPAHSYSQQITASGGTPPYNFYVGGSLPAGLTLSNTTNSTSCTLSGTPTQAGTFSIIAADGNDYVGSQYYTLTVH
jgi:hypothetical protein